MNRIFIIHFTQLGSGTLQCMSGIYYYYRVYIYLFVVAYQSLSFKLRYRFLSETDYKSYIYLMFRPLCEKRIYRFDTVDINLNNDIFPFILLFLVVAKAIVIDVSVNCDKSSVCGVVQKCPLGIYIGPFLSKYADRINYYKSLRYYIIKYKIIHKSKMNE